MNTIMNRKMICFGDIIINLDKVIKIIKIQYNDISKKEIHYIIRFVFENYSEDISYFDFKNQRNADFEQLIRLLCIPMETKNTNNNGI